MPAKTEPRDAIRTLSPISGPMGTTCSRSTGTLDAISVIHSHGWFGQMIRAKNNRLAAALRYARRGWYVHPVHSIKGGNCTCGNPKCKSPGKHPRTPHGVKDATRDPEV